MDKPKRILITRTDRMGDVILSTPAIRAIRQSYPEAYIAFMIMPRNKDILANNPELDEVIVFDKYGGQKSLWSTLMFAFNLKRKKFDLGIALHPTNRAHIIMYVAGIPERIGYDKNMPFLLTKRIAHSKQFGKKHEIDYNLDMLRIAGFKLKVVDRMPYIITNENEKKMVDAVLKTCGLSNKIIAIHAGASCRSRWWPAKRFAQVADQLSRKYKCDIVVVGGDDIEDISKETISYMKEKAIDLTGCLLLGELAEFVSRCKLFISNDSGPVHVAVAVKTPTIAIFGRNDPGLSPKRWAPVGEKDEYIHKPHDCEICLAHNCKKGFICLQNITVDDVLAAADNILQYN